MCTPYKVTHDTPISFGRYKGKKLKDIPAKYLLWLLQKDFLTGQMKQYLKKNAEIIKREQYL